jgi:large subunit ribosomal protein L13
MNTYLPTEEEIERKWYLIDAEDVVLGRMAVKIADMLRGRHKPMYTPHIDTGDFIVVINADKVFLSGAKDDKKIYQDYSGWMGGQTEQTAKEVRAKNPARLVEDAVRRMLPGNRLARQQFTKLKVYSGSEHPHGSQKPETITV